MKSKKMKLLIAVLSLVMVMSVVISGCGAGGTSTSNSGNAGETGEAAVKTLRLGHVTQTTHPFHLGAQHFADVVKERSNGSIAIEIYPARQLGDDRELLEQIMNGTLDMGVISSPLFGNYTPVLDSLQLPFLINDYGLLQQATTSEPMKEILQSLEGQGLKAFAVYEGGMRHLANNERPIQKPEDLKGLKLRVVPSNLITEIFQTLGASPTPMAYGEVYSALQTGVIDGEEVNLTSIQSEKHDEVLKYVTLSGQFPFPGVHIMNSNTFKTLTPEEQKLLEDAANDTISYVIGELEKLDESALQTMKEKGVQVNEIEDIQPFLDQVEPIYQTYMAKDPLIEKFVNYVQGLKK